MPYVRKGGKVCPVCHREIRGGSPRLDDAHGRPCHLGCAMKERRKAK